MSAITIGVMGASGGVGASTLALGLCGLAAQRSQAVVIVDARARSGGLDVTAGLDREPGLRWEHLRMVQGPVPGMDLLGRLPGSEGVRVLSHSRDPGGRVPRQAVLDIVQSLILAADVCVIDLPTLDDPIWEPLSLVSAHLLVVAGCHPPGLAAVGALAAELDTRAFSRPPATTTGDAPGPLLWLVQRLSGADPDFAGVVAETVGWPLAGELPDDKRVAGDVLRGRFPGTSRGPFSRACARVWTAVTGHAER